LGNHRDWLSVHRLIDIDNLVVDNGLTRLDTQDVA
jgi:hypothetical protein